MLKKTGESRRLVGKEVKKIPELDFTDMKMMEYFEYLKENVQILQVDGVKKIGDFDPYFHEMLIYKVTDLIQDIGKDLLS